VSVSQRTSMVSGLPWPPAADALRPLGHNGVWRRRILVAVGFLLGLWVLLTASSGPAQAEVGERSGTASQANAGQSVSAQAPARPASIPVIGTDSTSGSGSGSVEEPAAAPEVEPDPVVVTERSDRPRTPPPQRAPSTDTVTAKQPSVPPSLPAPAPPSWDGSGDVLADAAPSAAVAPGADVLGTPAPDVSPDVSVPVVAVAGTKTPPAPGGNEASPAQAGDQASSTLDAAPSPPSAMSSVAVDAALLPSMVEGGLPETAADLCTPFDAASAIRPGTGVSARGAAARSSADVDGVISSFLGSSLEVPLGHPLTAPLPIPLGLPVLPLGPAPHCPAGSSAAGLSAGSGFGPQHTQHRVVGVAVLGDEFVAPLNPTSVRCASGFSGDVVGGADDPGVRPG
jgi:hypothetical protein